MYFPYEPSNKYQQSKNNNFIYGKMEKYIKIHFYNFRNSVSQK